MVVSGISWVDITRMIKDERKAGNYLANLIHQLNLEKNQVTLLLDSINDDEDFSSGNFTIDEKFTNFDPVLRVDIDLNLTAQTNIQKYFEIKKKSYEKEIKTRQAADIAIKDAETNAAKELNKFRKT